MVRAMSETGSATFRRWGGLFLLFFLSGISGLIYESIWSRYIRLFVGSASTAQILVLSLFMGGMSLGALLSGRLIPKVRAPVMVYGLIEGLIGAYALAFPYLQAGAMRVCYDVLFPALGGGAAVSVAKWGVATLLVLPPCVLLGMTFPLMSVGILRRDLKRAGEILSLLYFTNSLGASLGAVMSGFALVGWIGLPGTLQFAAAINILIMLVAIRDRTPTPAIESRQPTEEEGGRKMAAPMFWIFLAVAFGTGLSSFMYEIGWIRLLSMILGSATHSFEVMLSAFIFGLASGSLWVRKRMDKFKHPELVLAGVQLIMGMAAIATLPAYRLAIGGISSVLVEEPYTEVVRIVQEIPVWLGFEASQGLWIEFNVVRYLMCLLIMFPATFCAGMTLPLLTHVMLKRGQPESAVGQVYGVNTLGAITGAVAAGLILMPLVGLKMVIILGALVDIGLGFALFRLEMKRKDAVPGLAKVVRFALAGSLLTVGLGIFVVKLDPMHLTSTVFRRGRTRLPDEFNMLMYEDGRTASVAVIENSAHPGYRVIYTNGKPDASVVLDRWPEDRPKDKGPDIAGDEPNQFLVGLVPLMARPQATDAALIGFGSGVTCHVMLGSPNLERLDTIEIESKMVEGSKYFHPVNRRAYEDPRNTIVFDDAKAFFASAATQYDIIVSEPTNPWVSGVSSLFTVEFYREAKRYLKPGGVLAQWIQGYELSDELMVSVLAALEQEFEDYLVVRIGSLDWVILSVAEGEVGQLGADPIDWEGMKESLSVIGVHDIAQIDGLIVANRRILGPYLGDKTANSDALPLLDTGAERARFMRDAAEILPSIRWTAAPVVEVLGGIKRRPYPAGGIGDLREPHVLKETEQAVTLMRAFEDPDTPVAEAVSVNAMLAWFQAAQRVEGDEQGDERWNDFLISTYGVFKETVSHLPIHETPWWAEVRRLVAVHGAPADIKAAVEMLDALSAADAERLLPSVERALENQDYPLPYPLVTIAGVIGHEAAGSSPQERRAFAEKYMMKVGEGDSSDDRAYQVLRAFAMRE